MSCHIFHPDAVCVCTSQDVQPSNQKDSEGSLRAEAGDAGGMWPFGVARLHALVRFEIRDVNHCHNYFNGAAVRDLY